MPWDPQVYNRYKAIRNRPFYDLVAMINPQTAGTAIDIGCGTGEQTHILSRHFTNCTFLGIDSSAEMLAESKAYNAPNLNFENKTIEQCVQSDTKWDLIFSNAALQWSDDHESLFPQIIGKLKKNGQLAIQMPMQLDNILNQILLQIVQQSPFTQYLNGFVRRTPMLSIDQYTHILFANGLDALNISVRVYPVIAEDAQELYNFIAGSALIPYMDRLDSENGASLKQAFIQRIENVYPSFPAIYSFKRILLYGIKNED